MNRPTQLQSKQQASAANNPAPAPAPVPAPLLLPSQDENMSSHDTINSNTTGTTYVSLNIDASIFAQSLF